MRLAFLSPTIVEKVIEGRAPVELNLQSLMTMRITLPLGWREQEELLPALRLCRRLVIVEVVEAGSVWPSYAD
jgi:hypothetical protein